MRFRTHFLIAGALVAIAGTAWAQAPAKVLKVAPSADVQELDPTRGRRGRGGAFWARLIRDVSPILRNQALAI